jgi:3-hydroxybutyrate dehydrogenase
MGSTGKKVLVTGAGSGIGEAIAKKFAQEGFDVIVVDINDSGKKVADEIGGHFLKADLSSMDETTLLAEKALALTGGIDILVNNAGFQTISPVEEFPDEIWAKMIQVMLIAPFQLTKRFIPSMKENNWGRVINISSLHGVVASPYKSAYISAKHGIIGLTKTVALEAANDGVTVNAICPAYVRTPLVEKQIATQATTHNIPPEEVVEKIMLEPAAIKRLIEPEEVADFALYLASDKARSITGAAHMIDLGWTAR